jgi:hypothetical protein
MSHGGIFGSDSEDDSDDEASPIMASKPTTTTSSSSSSSSSNPIASVVTTNTGGGIFDSDSDSDDDDLTGMSSLKPSTKPGDRSTAVKNAAASARRKREEAAKKKDGSSSDSYDSESEDSENDNDRGFIDNNGVDKGDLNETRFYNGKRDERPEPRRSRKPRDALDEAMERLKKPKNKTNLSEEQLQDQARNFVTKMNRAYTSDQRAKRDGRPALNKIKMLKEVVSVLSKSGMRERFLQNQVCAVVVSWLEVGKDGVLPTLAIRSKMFHIMNKMTPKGKVDPEDMRRYLHSSRIGSIFNFYSQHPEETKDNKILLKKILERWMNEVVHGRSGNDFARSKKKRHRSRDALAGAAAGGGGGGKTRKKKRNKLNGQQEDDQKPVLSGNQYARAVPEALTFDFASVATGPVSRDEIVREDQLKSNKDNKDDLSKRAILKREFRRSGTALPKSQRPVKLSITGKGMHH